MKKPKKKPKKEITLSARERFLAHRLKIDGEYNGYHETKKSDAARIRRVLKSRYASEKCQHFLPKLRKLVKEYKMQTRPFSELLSDAFDLNDYYNAHRLNMQIDEGERMLILAEAEVAIEGKTEEEIAYMLLLEVS